MKASPVFPGASSGYVGGIASFFAWALGRACAGPGDGAADEVHVSLAGYNDWMLRATADYLFVMSPKRRGSIL